MLLPFTNLFIRNFDARLLRNAPASFEIHLAVRSFNIKRPYALLYRKESAELSFLFSVFLMFDISEHQTCYNHQQDLCNTDSHENAKRFEARLFKLEFRYECYSAEADTYEIKRS